MKYKRIISLAPSITESIFALGAESILVGRTDYCNYPPEVDTIDSIGGFITPDIEKIVNLKPDLVLATSTHKNEELQKLRNFNIAVEVIKTDDIFDSPDAILSIGKYINKENEAKSLAKKIKSELENLLYKVKDIKERKSVHYMCFTNKACGWKKKCTTTKLIEMAGGKQISTNGKELIASIVKGNPDVIIIPYHKSRKEWQETMDFINQNIELKETIALKNNNIRWISGELLLRPGPRTGEGFRQLIEAIHS